MLINTREYDVLKVLWKNKRDMLVSEIVDERSELTQSTVTAVVRKLYRDGLVEVGEIRHSGKVLSRAYHTTEKAKELLVKEIKELHQVARLVLDKDEVISLINAVYKDDFNA